jgi:hypothetical protein
MRHLTFLLIIFVLATVWASAQNSSNEQLIKCPIKEVAVPKVLIPGLTKEAKNDEITFADPNKPFSAEEIDLNGDGKPELEVTGNGDATNWPMWIFAKRGKQYVQLLKAFMGIYGYQVLKPTSFGYHNIMTIEHVSAAEHEITIYRFNGQKYKKLRSYDERSTE